MKKTIKRYDILNFINNILNVKEFEKQDFCPNGLQIDGGSDNISNIVTSVSVTDCVLNSLEENSLLLTHHGVFWNNERQGLTGFRANVAHKLFRTESSLASYHFPLDFHKEIGNNVLMILALLKGLQLNVSEEQLSFHKNFVGIRLDSKYCNITSLEIRRALFYIYGDSSNSRIQDFGNNDPSHLINKIAVCTGGGQALISEVFNLGYQCFITGESSLASELYAKANAMSFFCCGHKSTERDGIENLGNIVSDNFNLKVRYIDDGTMV